MTSQKQQIKELRKIVKMIKEAADNEDYEMTALLRKVQQHRLRTIIKSLINHNQTGRLNRAAQTNQEENKMTSTTFKNSTKRIESKIAKLAQHETHDWLSASDLNIVHRQLMRYLAKWSRSDDADRDILEAVVQYYKDEAERIVSMPREIIELA